MDEPSGRDTADISRRAFLEGTSAALVVAAHALWVMWRAMRATTASSASKVMLPVASKTALRVNPASSASHRPGCQRA